ncbi:MAG: methyltransferase domain-containing protein [Alphaproteobacteria bacterium]|nr:methyltransferase domain-containing protein [Alphaproteobacteria bacterium]
MKSPHARRARAGAARQSLGPISDLESHLPAEWWREIFDSLYLKTDSDVVEDDRNTAHEIDQVIQATGMEPDAHILDLCCGQGRHVLDLARRGFRHLTGVDRSRYLIRLARRRARAGGVNVAFKEGDARSVRLPEASQDYVMVLGNSFGYFASEKDDAQVLAAIARVLKSHGQIVLDLTDGQWMREHFDPRSWEWIDEHQFVCRERTLSADGDRLISREVIVHDERGVIADQFYAERLYSRDSITRLLRGADFREVRLHGSLEAQSDRGQDLGMMARRMLLTARAPEKTARLARPARRGPMDVAVLLGDPRLPDAVKRGGEFNDEDFDTVRRLKEALAELPQYRFRFHDNHATLVRDLQAEKTDLVLNLCDEGFNNDAFQELHVPALLEALNLPYTGAGPACLGICYDKALVRAVALGLDVPVPMETYVASGDRSATLPATFPAILKPNFGDSSIGITKDAVVNDKIGLIEYLERLRTQWGDRPVLVQEYLTGAEYTVGLMGNPAGGLEPLPLLEVDFSGLPDDLPRILGYESKWEPDSPYWTNIRYRKANLPELDQRRLVDHSSRLFERLGCRDYARFDFRADANGVVKLLEVNPNPGWCWDGKMNLMAELAGWSYADFLLRLLDSAAERHQAAATMAAVDEAIRVQGENVAAG